MINSNYDIIIFTSEKIHIVCLRHCKYIIMISMCVSLIQTLEEFVRVHAFVTIQEVGPQTTKLALFLIKVYEIWNCTIFVKWIFRGKSNLCIYTKHSLFTIDLLEQKTYAFIQFFDFSQNWHFCTPIIVNIPLPHPSIQNIWYTKNLLKTL